MRSKLRNVEKIRRLAKTKMFFQSFFETKMLFTRCRKSSTCCANEDWKSNIDIYFLMINFNVNVISENLYHWVTSDKCNVYNENILLANFFHKWVCYFQCLCFKLVESPAWFGGRGAAVVVDSADYASVGMHASSRQKPRQLYVSGFRSCPPARRR